MKPRLSSSSKFDSLKRRRKTRKKDTMKLEPKVEWPKLGDDGPGGKEIWIFHERYEEIAPIANDGEGMNDREMLMVLKTNLYDSKRKSTRTSTASCSISSTRTQDHQ